MSLNLHLHLYLLCSTSSNLNLSQVVIHAIGDKANDMVLDVYESVILTNGKRDRRFRVNFVAQTWTEGSTTLFFSFLNIWVDDGYSVCNISLGTNIWLIKNYSDWACSTFGTWSSCSIWQTTSCCFSTGSLSILYQTYCWWFSAIVTMVFLRGTSRIPYLYTMLVLKRNQKIQTLNW